MKIFLRYRASYTVSYWEFTDFTCTTKQKYDLLTIHFIVTWYGIIKCYFKWYCTLFSKTNIICIRHKYMYYIELIFILLFKQDTCYIKHGCHCFEFTVRNKINKQCENWKWKHKIQNIFYQFVVKIYHTSIGCKWNNHTVPIIISIFNVEWNHTFYTFQISISNNYLIMQQSIMLWIFYFKKYFLLSVNLLNQMIL